MSFDAEAVRTFERTGWDRAAATYGGSFAAATRQFVPALLEGLGRGDRVLADLTQAHLEELRVLAPALVETLHAVVPPRDKAAGERSYD